MNTQSIFNIIIVSILIIAGLWIFTSLATDLGSGHQYSGDYPIVPERAN